jgi:hypothetical protein
MRGTAAIVPAIAAALVSYAILGTQDDKAAPASRPDAQRSDRPVVVLTGNEHGFIRPCGCSKPALGGVHRRAHVIAELRKTEPKLAPVSLGEFLNESNREQELKFDAFLRSLTEMEYAGFVPGAGEFRLGKRLVVDGRGMTPVPFVVANAEYEGEPPFEKSVKLGDTGGVLVGLVATLPPEYGVKVSPAADALRAEAAKAGDAAFILVGYNGPVEDLERLAAAVPEALRPRTVFAVPGFADVPVPLAPVLGMPVVSPGMKGKAIGVLRPGSHPLYESRILEEALPGLPSVEAILEDYRKSVKDDALMKNVAKTPAPDAYVGDKKCAECHKEAYETLLTTPHQRAVKSLAKTHDDFDPECVRCHVTGWAMQGGFVDYETTPVHKNVNCEACHGPGAAHSAKPEVKTVNGRIDKNTCLRCHDPDNSPHFKFEEYWPRIEHGLNADSRPASRSGTPK